MSPGGSSVASSSQSQLILVSRVSPASSLVSLNSDLSSAMMAPSGSPGSYQARPRQVSPYNYSGSDTVSWACRQATSASVENINKLDTRSEVHINISINVSGTSVFSSFFSFSSSKMFLKLVIASRFLFSGSEHPADLKDHGSSVLCGPHGG